MKEKTFNTRNKIVISDSEDFELVIEDIFEEFLRTFTIENELIRQITVEEEDAYGYAFMYTSKGIRLAETMRRRLIAVGNKYFPDDNISINSFLYQD